MLAASRLKETFDAVLRTDKNRGCVVDVCKCYTEEEEVVVTPGSWYHKNVEYIISIENI